VRPRGAPDAWALAWVLLAAGLAVGTSLHELLGRHWEFVIWSDRGLVRSLVPWSSLPTSGAELSFGPGARIPGGAEAMLIKAAWSTMLEPGFVWQVQAGLDLVATSAMGAATWRWWGPPGVGGGQPRQVGPAAAGAAMVFYTFNPAHTRSYAPSGMRDSRRCSSRACCCWPCAWPT
jgi:hypothetical protein